MFMVWNLATATASTATAALEEEQSKSFTQDTATIPKADDTRSLGCWVSVLDVLFWLLQYRLQPFQFVGGHSYLAR